MLLVALAAFVVYGIWQARRPDCGDCDSGFLVFWGAALNLVTWTVGCAVGFLLRNFRRLVTTDD